MTTPFNAHTRTLVNAHEYVSNAYKQHHSNAHTVEISKSNPLEILSVFSGLFRLLANYEQVI